MPGPVKLHTLTHYWS